MLSNLCGKLNESDVDKTNELHFVENLNDLKLRITRNCFSGNLINGFYDSNKNIKTKSVSDCAPLDESLSFDCNCDNKITTNHCKSANKPTNKNFYSKLYDQSLNQINVSNKIERKRNINMMLLDGAGDGDGVSFGSTQLNENALNSHCSDPKKRKLNGVSDSTVSEGDTASSTDTGKEKMYQLYQPWVLKTYGDQAKTKTITLKKQTRIIYALKGLESNKPDSSKFRFWVKSKGFMMELPAEYKNLPKYQENINDGCLLYVPSKSDTNNIMFKRVAVVEYFFNIIYKVHCSVIGEGRHVGQKRTYRKIQESYSFLPREAVTKFLSQCFECRRTLRTTNLIPDIKEEISEDKDINNQSLLSSSTSDNPNNIENYYLLLKALYENSIFNKAKSGHIDVQSSEKKFESFKENIYSNQDTNSNQQIYHKNININMNLKNESENLIKENENLGNIIINSLDVSINVGKAQNNYGNVNKVRISCTTTPTKSNLPNANNNNNIDDQHLDEKDDEVGDKGDGGGQSNQQLDIVSSSCIGDKEDPFDNGDTQLPTTLADTIHLQQQYECKKQLSKYDGDDNLTTSNNISMTRAVYNHREDKFRYQEIPDDTCIDYHNIKEYYDDGKTSIKMKNNATETNNGPMPKYQPITSTYLLMTRSMGLSDEDALNLDSISAPNENNEQANLEDSYANLLKDADKLKLMLLAWNYQNSAAVRNNTTGPDLATMSNLWEQYQSALAMSTKPINEQESLSPTQSQEEGNNSPSDVKEEDEGSEDESDDRIDQAAHDPERLKAFNMFVRMFVDENLDRMVPISKQPKEKVQAIIDSCTRQFPEFAERARKRLRTYLKSCRRNKKTKDGWENQPSRPTPAHLTSVQAEQILAIACENESMNAKRMRIGLEPITQSITIPSTHTSESGGAPLYTTAKSVESITTPLSITTNIPNCKTSPAISTTTDTNANSISSILNSSRTVTLPSSTPYNLDFSNGFGSKSGVINNTSGFYNPTSLNSTQTQGTGPTDLSVKRPLLPHKLNVTEVSAVKQLITGYRESAAFLLRSADELEQLLLNQQQ